MAKRSGVPRNKRLSGPPCLMEVIRQFSGGFVFDYVGLWRYWIAAGSLILHVRVFSRYSNSIIYISILVNEFPRKGRYYIPVYVLMMLNVKITMSQRSWYFFVELYKNVRECQPASLTIDLVILIDYVNFDIEISFQSFKMQSFVPLDFLSNGFILRLMTCHWTTPRFDQLININNDGEYRLSGGFLGW